MTVAKDFSGRSEFTAVEKGTLTILAGIDAKTLDFQVRLVNWAYYVDVDDRSASPAESVLWPFVRVESGVVTGYYVVPPVLLLIVIVAFAAWYGRKRTK